jgi:hypothetical protein
MVGVQKCWASGDGDRETYRTPFSEHGSIDALPGARLGPTTKATAQRRKQEEFQTLRKFPGWQSFPTIHPESRQNFRLGIPSKNRMASEKLQGAQRSYSREIPQKHSISDSCALGAPHSAGSL